MLQHLNSILEIFSEDPTSFCMFGYDLLLWNIAKAKILMWKYLSTCRDRKNRFHIMHDQFDFARKIKTRITFMDNHKSGVYRFAVNSKFYWLSHKRMSARLVSFDYSKVEMFPRKCFTANRASFSIMVENVFLLRIAWVFLPLLHSLNILTNHILTSTDRAIAIHVHCLCIHSIAVQFGLRWRIVWQNNARGFIWEVSCFINIRLEHIVRNRPKKALHACVCR